MLALPALAGDLACSTGPALVGLVSGFAGDHMKLGILAALIFPLIMTLYLKPGGLKEE